MSFRFQQFTINDDRCSLKVGTDAVLLGAWCDAGDVQSVLDVGAGSGVVALILAQHSDDASRITAVELDYEAALDCASNFEESPWSNRLSIVNADFATLDGKYDLIVSNPPFFSGDLQSPDPLRMLARQGDTLNYFSLIEFAAGRLTPDGRLVFISDARHEKDIIFAAELNRLKLHKLCYVKSSPDKPVKRILWEYRLNEPEKISKFAMSLNDPDGRMSTEFNKLTSDLYLNEIR